MKWRTFYIQRESTDFLRRIIAPSDGVRGVTLSYVTLEDNIWWVLLGDGNKKKKEAVQVVVCSLWRPV